MIDRNRTAGLERQARARQENGSASETGGNALVSSASEEGGESGAANPRAVFISLKILNQGSCVFLIEANLLDRGDIAKNSKLSMNNASLREEEKSELAKLIHFM